ncbi:MAG: ATP-binding protein [Pseudomonadota bacterium]
MPSVHLTLPDDTGDFTAILDQLDGFFRAAGLPPALIAKINLVSDEILTNILSHGRAESPVEIHCVVGKEELRLQFRDRGIPFNPLTRPVPRTDLPLVDRPIGGLGIHIVSQLMDRIEYRREGYYNCLTLFMRLSVDESGPSERC